MPRTISLIPAVAAAFAVAVPTAAAEGQPTGSHRWATQPAASDTYHRSMAAIAAQQAMLSARRSPSTVNALEARERALAAKSESVLASDFYADGFAQAVTHASRVRSPFATTGSASGRRTHRCS